MTAIDYLAADNQNHTPVSAANPLPVSSVGGSAAIPANGVAVANSSGNVANASAVATLAGAASKTTYIRGFTITPGGSTAAGIVTATLTGLLGGTLSFTIGSPAGAGVAGSPLQVSFGDGAPASAQNTAIVLTLPALGSGNTNASVSAWGYQL